MALVGGVTTGFSLHTDVLNVKHKSASDDICADGTYCDDCTV